MRIGYLITEYPVLSHSFIRREVVELRARGVDITTFSIRRTDPAKLISDADRQEARTTTNILPMSPVTLVIAQLQQLLSGPLRYFAVLAAALRDRRPGLRSFVYGFFYFLEAMVLVRALKQRGVTHLHNHFANSGADVGVLAARYLDIPWSMSLHGTVDFEYPASVTLGAKVRQARFVACVSHFGRAQAMRTVPASHWDRIEVVRCGVDAAPLRALSEGRTPGSPIRILSVGRLSEEKGLHGLLDAFAELSADGRDVELHLVGDGPEREPLRARIAELGLGERVTMHGALAGEALLSQYGAADIFVSSSLMEGLPVVLMEAMLAGVAVVAPGLSGIPELVSHERTGLLFTPGDAAALARALRRLVEDGALRARLASAGSQKALEQHEIGVAVQPLLHHFAPDA